MTNCKNCGAPLKTHKCDYCGTNFNKIDTKNNIGNQSIEYTEYIAQKLEEVLNYSEHILKIKN